MPSHGREKVRKDTLDLRDIYYEPTLEELPRELDNYELVPHVLDQESEGACVGFALAAVVNYLLANRSDVGKAKPAAVSARMLYEMARRYDEWEGEDYDGSSLRGGMKGWFHHGVTTETKWPYDPGTPGSFTPDAALDAKKRPLGAYYRVRHRHLNQMHAAINETGILLASAAVHSGWDDTDTDGTIPYRTDVAGGHAFAIIGYNQTGFWIQNSWGPSWGFEGFGHLSYEDWLENGWDCWVARIGVPVEAFGPGDLSVSARARFDYVPYAEVDPRAISNHLVHLGDDGALKRTGRFPNDKADLHALVHQRIPEATGAWSKRRVVLYAHGGLNSGKASAARIASMKDPFLDNHIYPIHFMWETGLLTSIVGAVRHALSLDRAEGVGERFTDLIDEALELGARPLGRPIWSEMKQNAGLASAAGGGASLLVEELAALRDQGVELELHLVGHSAGSILHAYLLERLVGAGVPVKTLTLFAPACTTALFTEKVAAHARALDRLAVFNLNDEAERDDSVGPYRKSLLYLVSEAFERVRHEPILGMDRYLAGDARIKRLLGAPIDSGSTTHAYVRGKVPRSTIESKSTTHGGFDNDEATLNAMLRIILGAKPKKPF